MVTTDPIADLLTRIRNALTAGHETVEIPMSKIKLAISNLLLEEGYIKNVETYTDGNNHDKIKITLKYGPNREQVITGLKRISKPGLRVYVRHSELPRVLGGLGIAIVSTPKGVVTDKTARELGVGGEVLAYVW